MQYKTLGNTGLLVSTLCFGTMTFHGGTGLCTSHRQPSTRPEPTQLIKASIDAGINFFDTADVYSEGESEKTLGQSLKNLNIARKDVVIATKVYGRTGPGRNDVGASRGHIMDAVDASLRRLQTDHIDLYQIHGNDAVTPIEETLRALDTLVSQAKSATSASPTGRPGRSPRPSASPSSRTSPASTPCRPTTPSPAATSSATSSLSSKPKRPASSSGARSPAACSPASSPAKTRSPTTPAAPTSTSPSSTRSAPGTSSTSSPPSPRRTTAAPATHRPRLTSSPNPSSPPVIIGAKRLDQLHDNIAAVDLKLTADELKQLDEVSALPPEYPGWMLPFQGANRLENVPRPSSETK